jgi:hypothetical protein
MPPLVPPTGPPDAFDTTFTSRTAPSPAGEGFAQVFDLAAARARRTPTVTADPHIPDFVLDEMEAASRMFHALHAQGHELRFEQRLGGGVKAELRTTDGDFVRRVPLSEAIDVYGPGPEAA